MLTHGTLNTQDRLYIHSTCTSDMIVYESIVNHRGRDHDATHTTMPTQREVNIVVVVVAVVLLSH